MHSYCLHHSSRLLSPAISPEISLHLRYCLDDISLRQSCANWPTPWLPPAPAPSLKTGFEDCTGAMPTMDSVNSDSGGGAAAAAPLAGGAPVVPELYAPIAARTGLLGMRLKVRRQLRAEEEKPKLLLGTLRLAEASVRCRCSTCHDRSECRPPIVP